MKNVTKKENVPSALSEEELQRVAEYISILREWSLQPSDLNDRDDGTSTPRATTSGGATKAAPRSERTASSVTEDHAANR